MQPRRVRDALNQTPTELAELQVALAALAFGLFLLHPNQTFALPQYRAMATIATENVWGLIFASWGVLTAGATLFTADGLRTTLALGGFLLWAAVMGLTLYHTAAAGVVLFPLEVVVCGWILLRRVGTLR